MLKKATTVLIAAMMLVGCSSKTSVGKGSFLSGCIKAGSSASVCKCVYAHLEDTFTPEQMQMLGGTLQDADPDTLQAIVKDGIRFAAICRK
jgi:hypothetical protein